MWVPINEIDPPDFAREILRVVRERVDVVIDTAAHGRLIEWMNAVYGEGAKSADNAQNLIELLSRIYIAYLETIRGEEIHIGSLELMRGEETTIVHPLHHEFRGLSLLVADDIITNHLLGEFGIMPSSEDLEGNLKSDMLRLSASIGSNIGGESEQDYTSMFGALSYVVMSDHMALGSDIAGRQCHGSNDKDIVRVGDTGLPRNIPNRDPRTAVTQTVWGDHYSGAGRVRPIGRTWLGDVYGAMDDGARRVPAEAAIDNTGSLDADVANLVKGAHDILKKRGAMPLRVCAFVRQLGQIKQRQVRVPKSTDRRGPDGGTTPITLVIESQNEEQIRRTTEILNEEHPTANDFEGLNIIVLNPMEAEALREDRIVNKPKHKVNIMDKIYRHTLREVLIDRGYRIKMQSRDEEKDNEKHTQLNANEFRIHSLGYNATTDTVTANIDINDRAFLDAINRGDASVGAPFERALGHAFDARSVTCRWLGPHDSNTLEIEIHEPNEKLLSGSFRTNYMQMRHMGLWHPTFSFEALLAEGEVRRPQDIPYQARKLSLLETTADSDRPQLASESISALRELDRRIRPLIAHAKSGNWSGSLGAAGSDQQALNELNEFLRHNALEQLGHNGEWDDTESRCNQIATAHLEALTEQGVFEEITQDELRNMEPLSDSALNSGNIDFTSGNRVTRAVRRLMRINATRALSEIRRNREGSVSDINARRREVIDNVIDHLSTLQDELNARLDELRETEGEIYEELSDMGAVSVSDELSDLQNQADSINGQLATLRTARERELTWAQIQQEMDSPEFDQFIQSIESETGEPDIALDERVSLRAVIGICSHFEALDSLSHAQIQSHEANHELDYLSPDARLLVRLYNPFPKYFRPALWDTSKYWVVFGGHTIASGQAFLRVPILPRQLFSQQKSRVRPLPGLFFMHYASMPNDASAASGLNKAWSTTADNDGQAIGEDTGQNEEQRMTPVMQPLFPGVGQERINVPGWMREENRAGTSVHRAIKSKVWQGINQGITCLEDHPFTGDIMSRRGHMADDPNQLGPDVNNHNMLDTLNSTIYSILALEHSEEARTKGKAGFIDFLFFGNTLTDLTQAEAAALIHGVGQVVKEGMAYDQLRNSFPTFTNIERLARILHGDPTGNRAPVDPQWIAALAYSCQDTEIVDAILGECERLGRHLVRESNADDIQANRDLLESIRERLKQNQELSDAADRLLTDIYLCLGRRSWTEFWFTQIRAFTNQRHEYPYYDRNKNADGESGILEKPKRANIWGNLGRIGDVLNVQPIVQTIQDRLAPTQTVPFEAYEFANRLAFDEDYTYFDFVEELDQMYPGEENDPLRCAIHYHTCNLSTGERIASAYSYQYTPDVNRSEPTGTETLTISRDPAAMRATPGEPQVAGARETYYSGRIESDGPVQCQYWELPSGWRYYRHEFTPGQQGISFYRFSDRIRGPNRVGRMAARLAGREYEGNNEIFTQRGYAEFMMDPHGNIHLTHRDSYAALPVHVQDHHFLRRAAYHREAPEEEGTRRSRWLRNPLVRSAVALKQHADNVSDIVTRDIVDYVASIGHRKAGPLNAVIGAGGGILTGLSLGLKASVVVVAAGIGAVSVISKGAKGVVLTKEPAKTGVADEVKWPSEITDVAPGYRGWPKEVMDEYKKNRGAAKRVGLAKDTIQRAEDAGKRAEKEIRRQIAAHEPLDEMSPQEADQILATIGESAATLTDRCGYSKVIFVRGDLGDAAGAYQFRDRTHLYVIVNNNQRFAGRYGNKYPRVEAENMFHEVREAVWLKHWRFDAKEAHIIAWAELSAHLERRGELSEYLESEVDLMAETDWKKAKKSLDWKIARASLQGLLDEDRGYHRETMREAVECISREEFEGADRYLGSVDVTDNEDAIEERMDEISDREKGNRERIESKLDSLNKRVVKGKGRRRFIKRSLKLALLAGLTVLYFKYGDTDAQVISDDVETAFDFIYNSTLPATEFINDLFDFQGFTPEVFLKWIYRPAALILFILAWLPGSVATSLWRRSTGWITQNRVVKAFTDNRLARLIKSNRVTKGIGGFFKKHRKLITSVFVAPLLAPAALTAGKILLILALGVYGIYYFSPFIGYIIRSMQEKGSEIKIREQIEVIKDELLGEVPGVPTRSQRRAASSLAQEIYDIDQELDEREKGLMAQDVRHVSANHRERTAARYCERFASLRAELIREWRVQIGFIEPPDAGPQPPSGPTDERPPSVEPFDDVRPPSAEEILPEAERRKAYLRGRIEGAERMARKEDETRRKLAEDHLVALRQQLSELMAQDDEDASQEDVTSQIEAIGEVAGSMVDEIEATIRAQRQMTDILRSLPIAEIMPMTSNTQPTNSEHVADIRRKPVLVIGIPTATPGVAELTTSESATPGVAESVRERLKKMGRSDVLVISVDRDRMQEKMDKLNVPFGVILDVDNVEDIDEVLEPFMKELDLQGLFKDYPELLKVTDTATVIARPSKTAEAISTRDKVSVTLRRAAMINIIRDSRLIPVITSLDTEFIFANTSVIARSDRNVRPAKQSQNNNDLYEYSTLETAIIRKREEVKND